MNGFSIFGGEHALCIRYAENNFADVQMINVLVNIFRAGQSVKPTNTNLNTQQPAYVCSLDEQGDEFQVFHDHGLAMVPDSREREFLLQLLGLDGYNLTLQAVSVGEYVKLEQYFIGYVLAIVSNGYLVPLYKLCSTKDVCDRVEQFHKGKQVACQREGKSASVYAQNEYVYVDVGGKTEFAVKNQLLHLDLNLAESCITLLDS